MIKDENLSLRELLNEPASKLSLLDKIISYIILTIFSYSIISTLLTLI